MTVGGKSSNNSLEEEAELENLEVKRRDDEKKAGGQAGDKSECSLCQVVLLVDLCQVGFS